MGGGATERLEIGPDDAGQRMDRFLRKYLPGATLPLIYKLLRTAQVTRNGRRARPEDRLEEGDAVALHLGARLSDLRGAGGAPGRPAARERAAPAVAVLYRDGDVMAVDKPARLLVHPGEDGDAPTLLDSLRHLAPGSGALTFRPALAHRLDRDTSGVVLAGVSAAGLRGLEDALRRRLVRKTYLAVVLGVPEPRSGVVDAPLRREDVPRGDRPKVFVGGRRDAEAVTAYRVVGEGGECALLEVEPRTGRTHQIRAHLRHIGHPVLGDSTYGDRRRNEEARGRLGLWRQFLHAARVELDHPVTAARLVIEAPLPGELARALEGLGIPLPRVGGTPRGPTPRRKSAPRPRSGASPRPPRGRRTGSGGRRGGPGSGS